MANNWAIVIGINDYLHHPERKLNYAVNDAQKMGKFLSDRAGFGAAQVIQCLGDEAHRSSSTYPTCSNLLRILEQDLKPDRLGKIDRLWFYFSGHGVSRNGRDYLITSDCLEDKIERFGLPIDEVIAVLQLHEDADIVLILDACRQVVGKKNFDSPIGEETVAAAKERGITTIFSCDYGQYSYELEALHQGAFTYALIEGLAQHTLPYQLETYLRQRVPELHLQHRHDRVMQTPRIRIEPAAKAFQPLLPNAVTSTDITILIDRAREAELEEDFETAKRIWWQIIEVSQSGDRIQEARTAIDRIDRKIAQSRSGRTPPPPFPPDENDLSSQHFGANYYARLRDLLKAGEWKKADQETATRMAEVADRLKNLRAEDVKRFPNQDLQNIDRLWVKYSDGRFGFSVQRKIYLACGAEPNGKYPGEQIWQEFLKQVGWQREGNLAKPPSDLIFQLSAPPGHLPQLRLGTQNSLESLLSRPDL